MKNIFDLSKLDTREQGTVDDYAVPLKGEVGDPLGRLHTIGAPIITDELYLRDANGNISTLVTQIEGGRYFITVIIRDSSDNISNMDTTTSFWTGYV